jgi:hypothetical protein
MLFTLYIQIITFFPRYPLRAPSLVNVPEAMQPGLASPRSAQKVLAPNRSISPRDIQDMPGRAVRHHHVDGRGVWDWV